LILSFGVSPLLASSDVNVTYPMKISTLGSISGTLSFNATETHGLRIAFDPPTISMNLDSGILTISIGVPEGLAPGIYNVDIVATGEGQMYILAQEIQVLKYLIVTPADSFSPANLTVTAGSTVTWLRLNGAITQYDSGDHDVRFIGGGVNSPPLAQYQSWTYTFKTPGKYRYICTFHPGMQGEITVTP